MMIIALVVLTAVIAGLMMFIKGLRIVIRDYERGILYSRGRFKSILETGPHYILPYIQTVQIVDIRSVALSIPSQEIMTKDNISVKVSLAVLYKITAPEKTILSAQNYYQVLYLEAQLAMRAAFGAVTSEELFQEREKVDADISSKLAHKAAELGLALETVGIKDVMFPGPFRQAFAQVAEAKQAALAAMEKARGETATLRHLANAAKMLEGNPALVTLKTLQTAGDGKHTIVLGASGVFLPPIDKKE